MSNMPPPPPPGGGTPPPPPGGGAPPPPGAGTPPPVGSAGYGQPMAGGMPAFASFGKRLGGFIIDALITTAMFIPGIVYLLNGPTEIEPCGSGFEAGSLCEVPQGSTWAIAGVLWLAGLIGALAYYAILNGKGQTVGKKAVNIRLADKATGQPIGTGRALGRGLFAYFISSAICYLGYLWMIWDDESQTWQDKVVNSYVVEA